MLPECGPHVACFLPPIAPGLGHRYQHIAWLAVHEVRLRHRQGRTPMRTDTVNACTHPLAFVRAQRGWSYQRLARVVARRARDLGVANMAAERQKVWRWEHRGVVPDRVSQLALAAELGVPSERVESHPWPAWLPTGDAVRVDYPWNASGAITALLD